MRTTIIIALAVILAACSESTAPSQPDQPFPTFPLSNSVVMRFRDTLGLTYTATTETPSDVNFDVGSIAIPTKMSTIYIEDDVRKSVDSTLILARASGGMTYEVMRTTDGPKIYGFLSTALGSINPVKIPSSPTAQTYGQSVVVGGVAKRAWLVVDALPSVRARLYVDGVGLYQMGAATIIRDTISVSPLKYTDSVSFIFDKYRIY